MLRQQASLRRTVSRSNCTPVRSATPSNTRISSKARLTSMPSNDARLRPHWLAQIAASINHDFVADVGDGIERGDVAVAEPNATMGNRAAELGGLLRSMQCVSVAEVQAKGAEDLVESALLHADGRDDEGVPGADHRSGRKLALDAVPDLDDGVAFHSQHTFGNGRCLFTAKPAPHAGFADRRGRASRGRIDGITAVEANDAKTGLARFLHIVPVGRNPDRILFLRHDSEFTDRRVEDHGPALIDQRRSFSRRANSFEDDVPIASDVHLVLRGGNENGLSRILEIPQRGTGVRELRGDGIDPGLTLGRLRSERTEHGTAVVFDQLVDDLEAA